MSHRDADQVTTVAIVGAGPTGCTLALLLARLGISSALVERNPEPQQHPAACILNTRTMEVFREIGVEAQIMAACQDTLERGYITWVVSLAGRELGRCRVVPDDVEGMLALSPTHTVQFPQHKLEPMLWRAVEQSPRIAFHRHQQCVGVTQTEQEVSAELVHPQTGERSVIRADYLVACDGASSQVRRGLGIAMNGPVLQHMIGIHFVADLGRFVNHRKGILYWVLNRDVMGVLIAHWLPTEWVLFAPYFPPQQRIEDFTIPVCRELVAGALGTRDVPDLELKKIGAWVLTAKLAEKFQLGRVFLAGDAAHSFPPTGGLGLNTGVQDAHNLAWKLAAVVNGRAWPSLLDTYEPERRPVADINLRHSVRNYDKMNDLNKVVGLDFKHLQTLRKVQNNVLFRSLPRRLQRGLVKRALGWAMSKLYALDLDRERGEQSRAAFQALLPGQAPHYRFLGLDLGFSYSEGAVVPELSPKPQAADPVIDYLPTTWPGSRLPHLWVLQGEKRVSLHDLIDPRGMVLLTHPAGKESWQKVVLSAAAESAMPLQCLSVGKQIGADLVEEDGLWEQLAEVEPSGAILVRPDGHVAWRCSKLPADPAGELRAVLNHLGCRKMQPHSTPHACPVMRTTVVAIDPDHPDAELLARAASILKAGGLVAFPTETVYGLGANAFDPEAVARIFAAKGRPAVNPLIVHVASLEQGADLADWSDTAQRLAERFWPGPLTLVLPKRSTVPDVITAGGPTVALRMPSHALALALIAAAGVPLAAPSANRSNLLSPTRAEHVLAGLDGRIDMILDGGLTAGGLESTVLDVTTTPPRLLRPGLIGPAEIEAVVGRLQRSPEPAMASHAPHRSPGMLARHYAPRAALSVNAVDGRSVVESLVRQGRKVGWLTFEPTSIPKVIVVTMPRLPDEYAARLYAVLHDLDDTGVDHIVVDQPPDDEAWLAIHDRLRRASTL